MMTNPTIRIHDIETDKVVDRPMNASELAQYNLDQATAQAELTAKNQAEAAKSAAQSKLTALGLTVEDLKALGL
jgi:hypothetical protein